MALTLPHHLKERSRILGRWTDNPSGTFVLYWMCTALRTDENPALDVARILAERDDLPLLVYQGLSEHYKYSSDRHHTFILQGVQDIQRQFQPLGISYAFHLSTKSDRESHLVSLANRAAVVVTEDMPVDPPRRFLKRLAAQTTTPIVRVDTACIAPMQLAGEAYTRAFKFRGATKTLHQERLTRTWPELNIENEIFDMDDLPFKPVNLEVEEIADLVASCEIDHSVGPVVDTVGGSTSGYARWNQFKENRLSRYAKTRNNPLIDGVSRMSPYLHWGMVSPMRIAREASLIGNAGAEKYLDELLIWRELAYVFCFFREDHDQWSAVPDWARETLESHARDQRDNFYSSEELSRGKTGDRLWNAAQRSLRMQGELHNNVRMTWGKAILNWTESPQDALRTMIDLNHRYALDGRDPASYGGILWCLGQFDRPFEPGKPVIGTVRPRSTADHSKRLDVNAYSKKVNTPRFSPQPRVAVIGAGISGLFAARTLLDQGLKVTVFEKGRGVGGRMSTRRTDDNGAFDHGAQYFTVRDARFRRYVDAWIESGIVGRWPDRAIGDDQKFVVLGNGQQLSESNSAERFVGVPAMNVICRHLAADLKVHLKTRVAKIQCSTGIAQLFDEQHRKLGEFDRLIISAPAAQSAELLTDFPNLADQISNINMNPCWATMVTFGEPITHRWVGAFLHDSFLSWTARSSTKPGRDSSVENVVIHAGPDWTAANWDVDSDLIAKEMLAEFWQAAGIKERLPIHLQAHRWKYAIPSTPSGDGCFSDESGLVTACGDWASGARVEGAFLSGMSAAGRILGQLGPAAVDREPLQKELFGPSQI